ncbi:transglutaminase-like domain-containing protein [Oerskovia jenensis]|uniref:transglutaminase-like domain-containing protein n=1 Tax=Oerskovia jenensis TaxID=162169 RepID=UPI0036D81A93
MNDPSSHLEQVGTSAVHPAVARWVAHSPYSSPGEHAHLLRAAPTAPDALGQVARNVIAHYRAEAAVMPAERATDVDSRWLATILDLDHSRHGTALTEPREVCDRVGGCCRDHSLLTVGVLREHGIPARTRVGFVGYFTPGFHHDHVVVEHWADGRWVRWDPELTAGDPAFPFDPLDLPRGTGDVAEDLALPFVPAATAWLALRAGLADADLFGVDPGLPFRGDWFVHDYVLFELAHRQGDELLLWDTWGAMSTDDTLEGADLTLVDAIATLLVRADQGDQEAEDELTARYAADDRLHPGPRVRTLSLTGPSRWTDLTDRHLGAADRLRPPTA